MSDLHARHLHLRAPLWALGLALFTALACVPAVQAQQDDSNRKQRAGEFFALGVKHFEAEEWQQALEAFERAYRMAPHHAVRVNMAACFTKLGRPVEALFNYERFLHESEGDVSPAQKTHVEQAMAALEGQVGQVMIDVSPPEARVQIDGRAPRAMPDGRVLLPEGAYPVEVFAPGYQSYRGLLQVKGGEPSPLQVTLRPTPEGATGTAPQPEDEGWSEFKSIPTYGDKPVWARKVTRLSIAGTGLGVLIGSVVSGALLAKANNDLDEANQRFLDPNQDATGRLSAQLDAFDAQDRIETTRATTLALMAPGAALEVAALVLWLVAKKRGATRSATRLTPVVGPGYAGLSLSAQL